MYNKYVNYENHPVLDTVYEKRKNFYFGKTLGMTLEEKVNIHDTILKHGQSSGLYLEPIIADYLGFVVSKGLFGYDAETKCGRPVEIKTEKFSTNAKTPVALNAFGKVNNKQTHKGDDYKKDRPIIVTAGTCNETGMCIYLLWFDTKKLPEDANIFKTLNQKTANLGMNIYSQYPEAMEFVFSDMNLVEDAWEKGKLKKKLYAAIMKQYRPDASEVLGTATGVKPFAKIKLDEVSKIIYKRITNNNHSDTTKEFVAELNARGYRTATNLEWTLKRYYAKTKAIRKSCNI